MADIIITNKNEISLINIKNNSIKGVTVTKNGPRAIDKKTIKILNSLRIGDNAIKVKNDDGYDVYYDLDSKLLHYFKDGQEDFEKFIDANTHEYINAKEDKRNNGKLKAINYLIALSTGALIVINYFSLKTLVITNYNMDKNSSIYLATGADFDIPLSELIASETEGIYEPITVERMHELIQDNPNLNQDEIEFLDNDQLFKDLMPYFNDSSFKYVLEGRLADLKIESYNAIDMPNTLGYYANDNVIHILNYDKENYPNNYYDTLAHEFIHMLQSNYGHSYLVEGTAEIISYEYFENTQIDAYSDCVVNIKLLMEIIGPDPVLRSMVTNDFSYITNELKQHINGKDADKIEELFSIHYYDNLPEMNNVHNEIRELLKKAYENKFDEHIDSDVLYSMYTTNYKRYYFNTLYRDNPEYNNCTYTPTESISMKDAYDNNLVAFRTNEIKTMPYKEYLEKPFFAICSYFDKDNVKALSDAIEIKRITPVREVVGNLSVGSSMVTYTELGEEKIDTVDNLYNNKLISVEVPFIDTIYYTYDEYEALDNNTKSEAVRPNAKYESMVYVRNDINEDKVYFADADEDQITIDLPALPGCEYNMSLKRN